MFAYTPQNQVFDVLHLMTMWLGLQTFLQDEAAKLFKRLREAIDEDDNVKTLLEDHVKEGDEGCLQQPPTDRTVRRASRYSGDRFWIGDDEETHLNKKREEVVEVLRFKTLKAGYNLLMYAANKGKKTSFDSLITSVKRWVRTCHPMRGSS